ncbi:MAG TPA: lysozyme [Candidatus Acidoferrum sp.]|nr:lysozyme [Candidatus Acidoferrum sp.]
MARAINNAGLDLIKSFEGLRLESYQDVAGIWTVGYGHIKNVTSGMTITEAQAMAFLRQDIADAEQTVDSACANVPTTDNQFAAMVSLCFNIGGGNFRSSSVLKSHIAKNSAAAADAFLKWDKAHVDGQLVVVNGLHKRREREKALYLLQA